MKAQAAKKKNRGTGPPKTLLRMGNRMTTSEPEDQLANVVKGMN